MVHQHSIGYADYFTLDAIVQSLTFWHLVILWATLGFWRQSLVRKKGRSLAGNTGYQLVLYLPGGSWLVGRLHIWASCFLGRISIGAN